MDYVKPPEAASNMLAAAAVKVNLPVSSLLIRGMLAGAYLAVATSMAITAAVQTNLPIVGALIFPFGLVLVVLLGGELLTGSFAVTPCAGVEGRASWGGVIGNWGWVALGNFLGSALYAYLLSISLTMDGAVEVNVVGKKLVALADAKVNGYIPHGMAGMITSFVKGILCNWMVSLGVVVAFTSSSVIGKIFALWGPVTLFFSQGWEHTVVNMFVIPAGMMMGANISVSDWLIWNTIPVTLGNLVGGMVFTGLAIYMTHRPAAPSPAAAPAAPVRA